MKIILGLDVVKEDAVVVAVVVVVVAVDHGEEGVRIEDPPPKVGVHTPS